MDGELARIFIGRLSPRTQERDLEHIFSPYGRVKRVDLKEGYAFVFFADQKHASEAIEAMDGKELDGNMIVVEAAHKHSNPKNNNVGRGNTELRISCSNLDQNTSWQDLKDWARAAGKVTFANVYTRDSQKLGVIEFETTSDVQNALRTLEDISCNGARVRLEKEDPNETGGFTNGGGGGIDRRGGGPGGGGNGYGRDLREKDRGNDNRDGGYQDRRGGGGAFGSTVDYRNSEGSSARGDDRFAARDRERDRGYDPRSGGESRFESRDAGHGRQTEPSRFSDDYRRDAPPGPSYPPSAAPRGFFRADDRREVMRREAPLRSRSRSRGRDREWGSNSPVPPARYREQPIAYRQDARSERRPAYEEYPTRADPRGDARADLRGDSRGDYRREPQPEFLARRAPAPVAYRGEVGYDRGSGGYEGRGAMFDRR